MKNKTSQRYRRYEKMLLLILDYLIWLMTAGSFILWVRIVTFMAGRRPSKGLRAWQKHRDGDCNWGQDNAGADWVWDLWELVKPCGASGGLGFCPDTFTKATQTHAGLCSFHVVSQLHLHTSKHIHFICIACRHAHKDTHKLRLISIFLTVNMWMGTVKSRFSFFTS